MNARVVAIAGVYFGAILIAVGVGILWGLGWALIALGAATIAVAVLMVDIPAVAAPRGEDDSASTTTRLPRVPPRPLRPPSPDPTEPPGAAGSSTRG